MKGSGLESNGTGSRGSDPATRQGRRRPRRLHEVVVLAVALTLVLAACGGGDDGDGASGDDDTTGTTAAPDTVTQSEGDPVPGGSLTVALEAETDGFDPTQNRWAVSGHMVGQAVFDSLAMFDAEGVAQPFLAQELVPNDDFTQWDIVLRDGVTFHNGEPLTAEAVKVNLEGHQASPLTAPAIRPIETVEVVDNLTARVSMNTPWSTFPVALTGQIGYVAAPTQLAGDDPAGQPVGTGPFELVEWVRDSNWRGKKNESYWRDGLPYLDGVEFRPIPDTTQRVNSLISGDVDMLHTSQPDSVSQLREEADAGNVQVVEDGGIGEESFVMLNMLESPTDDIRVRQALAHATDKETYVRVIDDEVRQPASSPFVESSPWYSEEAVDAYPEYDPERARALVEEYEAENGPIVIPLQTTPVPENAESVQFLAEMWQQVGIDVEFPTVQQSEFILTAVTGDFTANLWRQFGNPDPDGEFVWWDIENANPIGEFSLNFARIRDEQLQEAMLEGRSTTDTEVRQEAYDRAQVQINEQVPYIWLSHAVWSLAGANDIQNMAYFSLPDGQDGLPLYAGFSGATKLTNVWLEQ